MYKRPIPIQELRVEEGGGLIIHNGLIIRESVDSLCRDVTDTHIA